MIFNVKGGRFSLQERNTIFATFLVYLFHISAGIGILLGYIEWFAVKTPLNLSLLVLLTIWVYPIDSMKKILAGLGFLLAGMLVEILGVQYGLFFGEYSYGANLGPKFMGVPLLIGFNWALLIFLTGQMANSLHSRKILRVFTGSALMLFLDYFMEKVAPQMDFWEFVLDPVPFSNYLAWFVIACILHGIFQYLDIRGSRSFSWHAFAIQCLFFIFLCLYL